MHIGKLIREWQEALGIKSIELAERLDKRPQEISRLRSMGDPRISHVTEVSRALGLGLEEFLAGP